MMAIYCRHHINFYNMDKYDIELRKHKHIVFGSDHYNTLGAVRSLGEKGITPYVILHPNYNKYPHLVPNCRYVGEVYEVESVEKGFDLLLEKFSNEPLKPFVYSCDDWVASLMDENRDNLLSKFYFFHGGKQGIVTHYMDKDAISKLGEECGFNIPKAEQLKKGVLPKNLKYPVITKTVMSIKGAWKKDSFICYSPEELSEAYKKMVCDEVLVEEFIEKETEFCYDSFAVSDGKDVIMPFKATYIRTKPGAYGNYIQFTKTAEADIVSGVKKMISKVGYTGVFEAEFLLAKDGTVYFLEINWRNSTWSYPMTFGGVNMLYTWAKSELANDVDTQLIKTNTDSFVGIVEFVDFRDFVLTGKVSIFRWIKELIQADCKFFYNPKDKKPLYAQFIYMFKKILRIYK